MRLPDVTLLNWSLIIDLAIFMPPRLQAAYIRGCVVSGYDVCTGTRKQGSHL